MKVWIIREAPTDTCLGDPVAVCASSQVAARIILEDLEDRDGAPGPWIDVWDVAE